ncbi:MAG: VWA domain-containing protein [Bacteroidetes bacterium]|nr:VWA domain-containing protein [Bacteroidota bacterium]
MKSTTPYHLLLDMSGSMASARQVTLESVNSQMMAIRKTQESHPEQEIKVSFYTFNSTIYPVFQGLQPHQLPQLNTSQYSPDGCTALLDAIGLSITQIENSIQATDDVVIVIITDGEENASQGYNFKQIADKIAMLKKSERWVFSFLGAEIDAWQIAQQLNINREEVRNYSKENTKGTFEEINHLMEEYIIAKKNGLRKKGFMG